MLLDALFVNGRFRTGDPHRPTAHTLGTFGGLVVGLDDEVSGLRAVRVLDLGGAHAVPGFNDAHHPRSGAMHALADNATSNPEDLERLVHAIGTASEEALGAGLTSITERGTSDLTAYQAARARGLLAVRATVMPEISSLDDLGVRTGLGDDSLRIGAVTILGADTPTLAEQILAAHLAGWQVATDAPDGAALEAVLEAYEAADAILHRPQARHRIDHSGTIDEGLAQRIRRLGLVVVPQQRSAAAPLLGIHALVNGTPPEDGPSSGGAPLTVEQALYAYTAGSAYAERQEHRKGSLARGMLADFAVLSDDLFAVAPGRIKDVTVTATVVGGEVRYGAPALREL